MLLNQDQLVDLSIAFCSSFCIFLLLSLFSGSEKGCILTKFTMKTEDRATFEWENGKVAQADLTKENDECIYRYAMFKLKRL